MNINVNKPNNTKQFDTCAGTKSQQGFINDNKFARSPISDCFCKSNHPVSFQGGANELGNVLLKLEKFLNKDESLIAKTKCKKFSTDGKAQDIEVFITHRIVPGKASWIKDQEFYRLLTPEGKELGDMKVYCTMSNHAKYGTKTDEEVANGYLYLADMKTSGVIAANMPKSKREYSGLGTTLAKMAVKRSFEQGLEGRVMLEAGWNAHGFHYKNGFRVSDNQLVILDKKAIEKGIQDILAKSGLSKTMPNTRHINSVKMYLPQDNIKPLLNKGEEIELL